MAGPRHGVAGCEAGAHGACELRPLLICELRALPATSLNANFTAHWSGLKGNDVKGVRTDPWPLHGTL